MGIFDKLFTSFGKAFSKEGAIEAKAISKSTAKASTKAVRAAEITEGAARVEGIATQTKLATKIAPEGTFKKMATEIATSAPVKTAAKVGTAGVLIGGSVYGISQLGGAGLEKIGYSWRDMTDNKTTKDTQTDYLNYMKEQDQITQDKMKTAQDYIDFLKNNQLSDMPSSREAFDNYILGSGNQPTETKENFFEKNGALLTLGILGLAGAAIYLSTKKQGAKK